MPICRIQSNSFFPLSIDFKRINLIYPKVSTLIPLNMVQFTVTLLIVFAIAFSNADSFENVSEIQLVELILNLRNPKSNGVVIYVDDAYWIEHREIVDNLLDFYPTSYVFFLEDKKKITSALENWIRNPQFKEIFYNDMIIFQQDLNDFPLFYADLEQYLLMKNVIIVTNPSIQADKFLSTISRENVVLVIDHLQYIEICSKKINGYIQREILKRDSTIKFNDSLVQKSRNLMGRHLIVAALHQYPPAMFKKNISGINELIMDGIEPSIINVLSQSLNFTYNYILAAPTEMWGRVVYDNGYNINATGLMGLLIRKEVDLAIGEMYIDYSRLRYIRFTIPYKFGYECFLVPASQPYPKWTALYHPFTLIVWLAIFVSFFLAFLLLYYVSKWRYSTSLIDRSFEELQVCVLYVLGNMVGVQQPQEIRCTANRIFLICWFIAATIIPTGYRSGLISYMTFPFTPAPINTIDQLVRSPLKKIIFGDLIKDILNKSTSQQQKQLAQQLTVNRNLTYMFSLLSTNLWAVDSSQDNLRYIAATQFPTTSSGPQVHLMDECLIPMMAAFGLQKISPIKSYLDRQIQHLVEAGLVDYHRSKFAKKPDKWNPKASDGLVPFSLNSLQGAFYLFGFGIAISTICFVTEIVFSSSQRRNRNT